MLHLLPFVPEVWKSVRVADGARLESVYAVTCIVGSNPTSSDFFLVENLICLLGCDPNYVLMETDEVPFLWRS